MAVIPNGYAQVNWVLGGIGAPTGAEITCGLNVDGFAGSIEDAAFELHDAFVDIIIPEMTNKLGIDHTLVKYGPNDTGPSAVHTNPTLGPANVAITSPNVAYLIVKSTAFGGRAGKGRLYLPGIPETVISETGAIASGTVNALSNAFNALDARLEGSNLPPYLIHGPTSPLGAPDRITGWTCQSLAATQRRRMRR